MFRIKEEKILHYNLKNQISILLFVPADEKKKKKDSCILSKVIEIMRRSERGKTCSSNKEGDSSDLCKILTFSASLLSDCNTNEKMKSYLEYYL